MANVLIVFANEQDQTARALVKRWAHEGAVLMTPSDLARPGWCCTSSDPAHSQCILEGASYPSSAIRGVLIRSPFVFSSELPMIVAAERNFLAAEMNAFLIYWLNSLDAPVLNRPTPHSLCGPGWYPEHWTIRAASLGLKVRTIEQSVRMTHIQPSAWPQHSGPSVDITVVAGSCFGPCSPTLADRARALARAAGPDLVRFRFDSSADDACFLAADLLPPLDDEAIEAAVLGYFPNHHNAVAGVPI
jgi:hypothetical protein